MKKVLIQLCKSTKKYASCDPIPIKRMFHMNFLLCIVLQAFWECSSLFVHACMQVTFPCGSLFLDLDVLYICQSFLSVYLPSVYLSICLPSICLSGYNIPACLFLCRYVSLSICLSVSLPICIYVYLSICAYLSLCLPVSMSPFLFSISLLFVNLPIYLSVSRSICLSVLAINQSIAPSICGSP